MPAASNAPTESDRRVRYLEAALTLFAEHGYVGTTMDMVVAAAGGSKATLYRYFPSKEALIGGLVEDLVSSVHTSARGLGLEDAPLEEALMSIGRAALVGVTHPRVIALLRLSLGEYGRFPELAREVWDHGPAITYANFHEFLAEREARGEVQVEDRQLAAEQFIAGLVGHIQPKVAMGITDPPDPDEVERRVASNVATFLARYAAR